DRRRAGRRRRGDTSGKRRESRLMSKAAPTEHRPGRRGPFFAFPLRQLGYIPARSWPTLPRAVGFSFPPRAIPWLGRVGRHFLLRSKRSIADNRRLTRRSARSPRPATNPSARRRDRAAPSFPPADGFAPAPPPRAGRRLRPPRAAP